MSTKPFTVSAKSSGRPSPHFERSVTATYRVLTNNICAAANAIAMGQSIGHPTIRTTYDTATLLSKHQARATWRGEEITVSWPPQNFGEQDGINHLLSVILGGQCDIGIIRGCRLEQLHLGNWGRRLPGPHYGITGIRKLCAAANRPLLGSVLKPKIGCSPDTYADIARQLAEGGVDFIKEDEILGDPPSAPFKQRVYAISQVLKETRVIYAPCITGDGSEVLHKAELAGKLGAGAIHCNFWAGLGTYLDLRRNVELPIFFQKSGDKVWTTGGYSMTFEVLCRLVNRIGCDFAHVGMYGGYLSENINELTNRIIALSTTVPSFSCGAHPGIVRKLMELFGNDIMITAGGAIHGHPMGIKAGAMAFRQAMTWDGESAPPDELKAAVNLWAMG